MQNFRILLFFITVILIGCQPEASYQDADLIGNWKAVEWKDVTKDELIDVEVSFSFDADKRYVGSYGASEEKGKYWIAGDNLHTIEDGKAEKKVKIEKLANDTLVFGMNRMGNLERITLLKEN